MTNGTDLKDTLAISSRMKALETAVAAVNSTKSERNSEGYLYLCVCVLATVALCLGNIEAELWSYIVTGNAVAYGAGRIVLKKGVD